MIMGTMSTAIKSLIFYMNSAYVWLTYNVYYAIRGKNVPGIEEWNAVIVGAGFSGLNAGIRLNEIGMKDFKILEKSDRLGGTWWENQYPGVACDIPSHLYSLSCFPNPNWSMEYSKGAEIHDYLESLAVEFGLYPHIFFNEKMETSEWLEDIKKWKVTTSKGKTYLANFLIGATGPLHVPNIPDFKGIEKFKGKMFHSAQWPKDVDIVNRRVAVVGTGASSIQIVPNICEKVDQLFVMQRTAVWIPPRRNLMYSKWVKTLFAWFPFIMYLHRMFYFWSHELKLYTIFVVGDKIFNRIIKNKVLQYYDRTVKDETIRKKLTPNYIMGCKRITPSDGYLEAFNRENVHLITEGITEITEDGIVVTGKNGIQAKEIKVDIIVLATGFSPARSLVESFNVIGSSKGKTDDDWLTTPQAYLGIIRADFPNMFILLGPNTGLGHNTILYMMECQVTYICDVIRKLVPSTFKSVELKEDHPKVRDYKKYLQEGMLKRPFGTGKCAAWYFNEMGVNFTLWPGDLTEYWRATLEADMDIFCLR